MYTGEVGRFSWNIFGMKLETENLEFLSERKEALKS
jgi:hypothetical protein